MRVSKIGTYCNPAGNSHKIKRTVAYTPAKTINMAHNKYSNNLPNETRGCINLCRKPLPHQAMPAKINKIKNTGSGMSFMAEI